MFDCTGVFFAPPNHFFSKPSLVVDELQQVTLGSTDGILVSRLSSGPLATEASRKLTFGHGEDRWHLRSPFSFVLERRTLSLWIRATSCPIFPFLKVDSRQKILKYG